MRIETYFEEPDLRVVVPDEGLTLYLNVSILDYDEWSRLRLFFYARPTQMRSDWRSRPYRLAWQAEDDYGSHEDSCDDARRCLCATYFLLSDVESLEYMLVRLGRPILQACLDAPPLADALRRYMVQLDHALGSLRHYLYELSMIRERAERCEEPLYNRLTYAQAPGYRGVFYECELLQQEDPTPHDAVAHGLRLSHYFPHADLSRLGLHF